MRTRYSGDVTSGALWPVLAVTIAMLAPAYPAPATECTLYVRAGFAPPPGHAADGAAPLSAFDSIAVAARNLRNPGDVICVGPGAYIEGNITPARSGVPMFPIEFRADPSGASTGDLPGAVVIMPPPGLPAGSQPTAGFRLLGQRDVIIDGFEIEGFFDAAIQVRSGVAGEQASNVTIRNNAVRLSSKAGIDLSGEGLFMVEGNHVIGNGSTGVSVQHCPTEADGRELSPRCRGTSTEPLTPVISNNRIGINGAHGILLQDVEGALVQNNVVYSNGATGITARAAVDSVVLNNLVYANREEGVAIGVVGPASPDAAIANNTLYANGAWGIAIGNATASSPGALVIQNILGHNGGGFKGIGVLNENALAIRSTCGYVAGFNVVEDDYGPKTPWNVYDVRADPKLVAPLGADGVLGGYIGSSGIIDGSDDDDFHLRQRRGNADLSPAVDAGATTVALFGLTGSTAPDGAPDTGIVDAGFHYDASPTQVVTLAAPFMPLYVRAGGHDENKGKHPYDAFRTIGAAARRARAGVTVVVGPGVYQECDIGPPPDQGVAAFVADARGAATEERPGPVLVDAGCCRTKYAGDDCIAGQTGFNLPNACRVRIDGFSIRGATDDGIQVQSGSHWAEIRNNIAFSNTKRGIQVVNANDVSIVNNLAYANGGGIQIGGACRRASCDGAGAQRALIEHNTCYANSFDALLIGAGAGASTYATVHYNILHAGNGETGRQGKNALQLGSNTTSASHIEGYDAAFNVVVGGRYGGGTPRAVTDRVDDPLFVDPSGYDGVLGGDGFEDDSFQLQQRAAGDPLQSPAVDFSDVTALASGLSDRTTRSDGGPDVGLVDLGFHYPPGWQRAPRWGDCNGDGRATIDELVRAVGLALGGGDVASCPALDANGDGRISIDELVRAVRTAVQGR